MGGGFVYLVHVVLSTSLFASQEHDIPDYFQIILQIPLNTMGDALNVGCNCGGISAVKHYPHVTRVWVACVGTGSSAAAGWCYGGAS